MTLIGKTSNAQATITNVRLVSDLSATLIGSLFIPNPNSNIHPRFESGNKTFVLISNNLNNTDFAITRAEEKFLSTGILETVQENVISVRNARVGTIADFEEKLISRSTGTQVTNSRVVSQSSSSVTSPPPPSRSSGGGGSSSINSNRGGTPDIYAPYTPNIPGSATFFDRGKPSQTLVYVQEGNKNFVRTICHIDPLAQSFLVDEDTGIFLTRCDVFFRTKDNNGIPVILQIRTMQNGLPTSQVVPFSEIVIEPN